MKYEATQQEAQVFADNLSPTDPEQAKMFDKHWLFCFQRGLSAFLNSRTHDISCSIINNEVLADMYIKLSGTTRHTSDCATSCAPAETPGPCDCKEYRRKLEARLTPKQEQKGNGNS